jgi:hypothetical protein
MKKKMMFAVVLSMLILGSLSTSTVYAAKAWYTCTVVLVGGDGANVSVNLTDDGGAFSGKSFFFLTADATCANRYLATALTALSAGKKIMVYVDPLDGVYPSISGMYIIY